MTSHPADNDRPDPSNRLPGQRFDDHHHSAPRAAATGDPRLGNGAHRPASNRLPGQRNRLPGERHAGSPSVTCAAERENALRDASEELRRILPRRDVLALYRLRTLAERHLLTLNEVVVLIELLVRRHPLDGAALAETVGLGTGGITRLLARLEERDLVVRDPDPEDGRRLLASVSDEGRELLSDDLLGTDATELFAVVATERIGWVTSFLGRLTDLEIRRSRMEQDRRARRRQGRRRQRAYRDRPAHRSGWPHRNG
ncbi:MarR family winged helix-turn-helix transcriptional regulator [Pseudonocardia sp. HH130630-07]|uniref:MarR family winged helix-turn-helix transcriptional regulator n=1 Tax=Pseudonocardia sp. HH130630-07 TaxID=1690815 RepID=UPI000814F1CA|nr:MarR family transcriptional regulator [Pseudonocardia sp. HH130630-07]ANY08046.1 hypothetical protein AFB00_19090 [Pseudonocardia sp. HH130630-07]